MIIDPWLQGYYYPVQTPSRESCSLLIDAFAQCAQRCADQGTTLLLAHKNSEPPVKNHMGNVGRTRHTLHQLRARRPTRDRVLAPQTPARAAGAGEACAWRDRMR